MIKLESNNLYSDAITRDFTINALYYDIKNFKVMDPLNKGLDDLNSKTIEVVS